jgi:hypothetical protein|tara:strand:- start:3275 stop:3493 length:219 start_codon:yes stop_codon:yes gene_type:complete
MNASQPSLNYVALKEVQGVMGDGSPLLVETFFTDSFKLLTAIQSALDEGNTDPFVGQRTVLKAVLVICRQQR